MGLAARIRTLETQHRRKGGRLVFGTLSDDGLTVRVEDKTMTRAAWDELTREPNTLGILTVYSEDWK